MLKQYNEVNVVVCRWWQLWKETIFKSMLVLFTCTCLLVISALSLVAKQYPPIQQYNLGTTQINAETMLQLIGAINKFMDANVAGSLSFLGAAYISYGISQKKTGASIADFDLSECMTNPFKALYTIPRCYRQRRHTGRLLSLVNILVRVITSVSFILLPISMNTLVVPKAIWQPRPDSGGFPRTPSIVRDLTLITPMVYVSQLSWIISRSKSPMLPESSTEATNLIAAQVYEAFFDFPQAFTEHLRDWYNGKRYPNTATLIDTSSLPARAVTARAEDVQHIWQESKKYGPHYARYALEYWGKYNVSTPSVEVICEINETTSAQNLMQFDSTSSVSGSARLDIGNLSSLDFDAHTCHITTTHALFGFGASYLPQYDSTLNASTMFGKDKRPEDPTGRTYVQTETPDGFQDNVHEPLISMLAAQLPILSQLTIDTKADTPYPGCTNNPFTCFLAQMIRSIRDQNLDYTTDAQILSLVIAFWAQHTITLADWTLITDPVRMKSSFPSRYNVYASGPRLRWESAILIVPLWLFAVLFTGLCLTTWKRVRLLACTGAPGMLFVRKSQNSRSQKFFGTLDGEEDLEAALYETRVRIDDNGELEAV